MKKRSLLKRIAAMAMSAVMVLGVAGAANAATIDQTAGTLQIHKLRTGTDTGIAGVQFDYVQIGEFVLNTGNVGGFTITNNALKGYLTTAGLTAIAGTTDVYDGEDIQDALSAAMETEATKTAIENMATESFNLTGADGKTNVADVPIGIYLVVEKSAPAEVTKMADPFIVSVPILEEAEDGTQSWNYDVVAQPKNDYIDTPPEPQKEMVNGGADPSARIGETVSFKIKSTVPDMAGALVAFDFIDTLSAGLTLGDVTKVEATLEDNSVNDVTNTADLYTVTKNGQVLTVSFDPVKVQDAAYTEIAVTYTATLNEHAIVGSTGNTNDFEVQYTNDPTQNVDVTPVTVGTYGFTLQKHDENSASLAGATFKLYDAATGGNEVAFYTAISDQNQVTGNAVTEVTTADDNGQASFYGLKAGTYYLEETKAPTGYNLLKDRVEVTVSAASTTDGVDITIVNTKGFTLPTTGGTGTVIFTVGGIVIMLGAAFLLIRSNKKSRAK